MAYKVKIDPKIFKDYEKLDNSVKIQIVKLFDKIEAREDPRTLGEALESNLSGLWRYRVGKYRIVAKMMDDVMIVFVIEINKRDKVYKETDKKYQK